MKTHFTYAGAVLILCVAFIASSLQIHAQCRSFAKEQINKLSPFVYSGKTNSTVLMPGDHSELSLTFYSGQTYRIIMKSTENPLDVSFTIKDANNNLVFKSDKNRRSDFYDFTCESTQQLTIDMIAAENELLAESAVPPSQCVVVMVGRME